jgi:hypothetical protein
MAQEITTDHETTMGRDEITTSDEIQTTAPMMIRHGMDVPRGGRFRVETAHPTKARLVEGGIPRMVARPVTQYRAAFVSRIEDISPKSLRQPLTPPILLRLALNRWRFRIFHFQPKR